MFTFLLASSAGAETLNVRFCVQYEPNFDDAGEFGDDYVDDTSPNTVYPARGAWLRVKDLAGGLDYTEYTDWTGAYAGCSPTPLVVESGHLHTATVYSVAKVNGNYVWVYNDDVSFVPASKTSGIIIPTSSAPVYFQTPRGLGAWNIAMAAGHALYRRNAGLSAQVFQLFNVAGPGGGTEYDRGTDRVYISSAAQKKKYIIAHELGHQVAARVNYVGNGGVCAQDSCAADNDYSAPANGCYYNCGPQCDKHSFAQQEYASSAFWEGLAHYWAAVAFNNTTEADCSFVYYKDTDWNLDGLIEIDSTGLQETAPFAVSCASGPTLAPSADYLGDWCDDGTTPCGPAPNGNCDNRGTEFDWLRFFWDMDENGGVLTTDLFRIVDEADPDTWNDNDAGPLADDPAQRLRDGAVTILGSDVSIWDIYATYDGVHR